MNKKLIPIALCVLILSACKNPKIIEFDVTANGLSSGVFAIKTQGQQTIFGENIKDGKCTSKGQLDEPGFYLLDIAKDGAKERLPFEVYLEPGIYTITADASNLNKYPKIESDSKKQQEINNYNALNDELGKGIEQHTADLNKEMDVNGKSLSKDAFQTLSSRIAASEDKERNLQFTILEEFVKRYPESELAAHFMARQNYADSPQKYSDLLAKMSAAAKSSTEGKAIALALNASLKLQPGKKAPEIAGKTFDGKTFAEITAGKKLILIDFWRAINQVSRINHEKISGVYNDLQGRGFQVISVSLDSKDLWWKTAVKDDKLPWPQMCDLKGKDSPNRLNWNVSEIPAYYLVDGNWNIYKKDVPLGEIKADAAEYLDKHH